MPQILDAQNEQDSESIQNPHEQTEQLRNVIILSFGYTHIPKGAELGSESAEGFFVPSIGLDYMRRINPKWGFGVMFDLELDHYLIYHKEYEREEVFIAVGGVAYNLFPHFMVFTGAGIELEHERDLFVYRLGFEYAFHLGEDWIIAPALFFDWKEDYDTYALSIGIGYHF